MSPAINAPGRVRQRPIATSLDLIAARARREDVVEGAGAAIYIGNQRSHQID